MRFINSYRFTTASPTIYDNATVIYSLRNIFNWNKAILKIRRSSDNAVKWVFFDGVTITLSSLTGDDRMIKTATTLGIWIGSDDGFVEEWIGQTHDNILDINKVLFSKIGIQFQPQVVFNGVIDVAPSNNLPQIHSNGSDLFLVTDVAISELDSSNSHTIFTIANLETSGGLGAIFTTEQSTNIRYAGFLDNRVNALISLVQTSSGTSTVNASTQLNSTLPRLQTFIHTPNNISGYRNNVFTETTSYSNSYNNNLFRIFTQHGSLTDLVGGIQELVIFPSDKTSDLTTLHADINSYYTIY